MRLLVGVQGVMEVIRSFDTAGGAEVEVVEEGGEVEVEDVKDEEGEEEGGQEGQGGEDVSQH